MTHAPNTTRTVGILDGMAVSDQAFPEHWLAQVPAPDRSSALGTPGFGAHQPLAA